MPMKIPFPVSDTYRIRANMRPLARAGVGDRVHFIRDEAYPAYLAAKLDAIDAGGWSVCPPVERRPEDLVALNACWEASARALANEIPEALTLTDERALFADLGIELVREGPSSWRARFLDTVDALACRAQARVEAVDPALAFGEALALAVQADLVVMRGADDRTDAAEWLHVCLPSGWSAVDKAGLSFEAIHTPVPHNAPLTDNASGIVQTIIERGPFLRYVWGLHRDDALCHDPNVHTQPADLPLDDPDEAAATTWFRIERQTTLGVPNHNRALFTIRVQQAPLVDVITTPERALKMAAALRDMTPQLAIYKGVSGRRDALVRWLAERAG